MRKPILLVLSFCFSCIAVAQTVSCGSSFLTSDWSSIGPYQSDDAYLGRVTSIWLDEDDHDADFILAGTRASGVWKTTDGGDNWSNTTGFQLPATGIASMEKYTPLEESNHFYCTTSFDGSDRNVYHEGIIYSTDNASTWSEMTTYPSGFIREGVIQNIGSRKIKLRPSTSDLWVANGKKIFVYDAEDDWKTFGGLPHRFNMDDMTAPFTTPQSIHDIDFAPSDNNIAVVGASSRQWKCLFYTANAGATSGATWNTMLTPSPVTLPTGGFYEITAKSFITDDDIVYSFFRILVFNSDGSLFGKEFYLYEYAIVSGAILLDKTYTIISHNPPSYSMFDDIRIEEVGGTRYLFLGQSQSYFYRGVIPAVSGSMSLTQISSNTNSHIDIRSVGYYVNNSGELCAVLGHDGGVSKGDDILTITTTGWENINGFGLTI